MPLPLPTCAPTNDPCCNTLYVVAEHILQVVYNGQIECQPEGCEIPDLVAYVAHGIDVDDPTCDSIAVWLISIQPSTGSFDQMGMTLLSPLFRATYRVRLRETGYPVGYAEGDVIYAPDPNDVTFASLHSYAHGERMFMDIVNAHRTQTLVPDGCGKVQLGEFRPLWTSGGCVGWEMDVVVDVPWTLEIAGS